jgi:hypothetical protein
MAAWCAPSLRFAYATRPTPKRRPGETNPRPTRPFTAITRNAVLLACASLFGDVSTEMLYPVLPVFLTQTLGASGFGLGNSSTSFLVLQTQAMGVSLDRTILIYAAFNSGH